MPSYTSPLNIPYPNGSDSLRAAVSTIAQLQAEKVNDLIGAITGVNASAWVPITPRGAMTNIGAGTASSRAAGMTTLAVSLTGQHDANVWAFSLPVGHAPSRNLYVDVGDLNANVLHPMVVQSDGVCYFRYTANAAVVGTVTFRSA